MLKEDGYCVYPLFHMSTRLCFSTPNITERTYNINFYLHFIVKK